jgi:TRAP-type transport system periplasmic protein
VNVNLNAFNKLDEKTRNALVQAGKEMEAAVWKKIAEVDKEKEAISNKNGIETVPVSSELMNALTDVTKGIREDYLKTAPADAKAIVEEFHKKVGR